MFGLLPWLADSGANINDTNGYLKDLGTRRKGVSKIGITAEIQSETL